MPTFTFYDDVKTLWESNGEKPTGKFRWPFSFEIPTTVASTSLHSPSNLQKLDLRKSTTFYVPHTFLERGHTINIQYELEVQIIRGRFRTNSLYVHIGA
jgi:hypothetical protein